MVETPLTRTLRVVLLTLAAFLTGRLAYFAFAPHSRTYCMVLSIALFELIIFFHLRSCNSFAASKRLIYGSSLLYGVMWGLGLYLPLYSWIAEFVKTVPWITLSLLMSLFTGLIGVTIALIGRAQWSVSRAAFVPAIPILWTGVEALRMRFPFGGFSWGSPAYSQTGGVIGSASLWGSTSAVTFLTVLCATILATTVMVTVDLTRRSSGATKTSLQSLIAGVLVALVSISGSFIYEKHVDDAASPVGTITAAYIQGDVVAEGIGFNAIRMQVLRNHVNATKELAAAVSQGLLRQPDVVVWPENSADIDPLSDPTASALITEAAKAINAPILVGAVVGRQSHNDELNTVLLWDASGYEHQRHVKHHIQPFGEYLPLRPLIEKISPYAAWAGNFQAGDGPGVIDVHKTRVGIATCYEVIFNDSLQKAVSNGAQWLTVPANNATFGYTNQTYQQLEMARFRARELHRWVVAAATSGVSSFITPTGQALDTTDLYTRAFAVRRISLYNYQTLSPILSKYFDMAFATATILIFAASVARVLSRRRRRL